MPVDFLPLDDLGYVNNGGVAASLAFWLVSARHHLRLFPALTGLDSRLISSTSDRLIFNSPANA
jgi:hypothetical protein